ncbi:hypothetical protein ACO02O_07098 [Dirofilaria immitis]
MMAIVVMMDGNGSGGLKYEMSTYAFFQSCTTRTPISKKRCKQESCIYHTCRFRANSEHVSSQLIQIA